MTISKLMINLFKLLLCNRLLWSRVPLSLSLKLTQRPSPVWLARRRQRYQPKQAQAKRLNGLLRQVLVLLLLLSLLIWLTACSKDFAAQSQTTRVVTVPKALVVSCSGEAPPTGEELLTARKQYPVEKQYQDEQTQWDAFLKTLPADQAEAIQAKIDQAYDWEARFLLMSDKFMGQTDKLGLCNTRLKTIDAWSDQVQRAASAGSNP